MGKSSPQKLFWIKKQAFVKVLSNTIIIRLTLSAFIWLIGYGFVDFQDPSDAQKAVQCLQSNGVQAQFAKVSKVNIG